MARFPGLGRRNQFDAGAAGAAAASSKPRGRYNWETGRVEPIEPLTPPPPKADAPVGSPRQFAGPSNGALAMAHHALSTGSALQSLMGKGGIQHIAAFAAGHHLAPTTTPFGRMLGERQKAVKRAEAEEGDELFEATKGSRRENQHFYRDQMGEEPVGPNGLGPKLSEQGDLKRDLRL